MEQNFSTKKWYDSKALIVILFFIMPPLGIYGMAKRNTVSWKKVLYILPASFLIILFIIGIVGTILIDNYKSGLDNYNKQNYIEAYQNFEKVAPNDKNYNDAILKMKEIKPIVDSLIQVNENDRLALETEKENEKNNQEKAKEISKDPSTAFPQKQQDFLTVIKESEIEYKDAPNELKKSAVKTNRGEKIKNALGNSLNFDEWFGIVQNMRTTSNGKAIFHVIIEGTEISIMTMNNEFSDSYEKTLIDQKNPLYNVISELKEGDKVRISGTFLKSPKNDFIFEGSLTEEGGIIEPDFYAKFNKIIKE